MGKPRIIAISVNCPAPKLSYYARINPNGSYYFSNVNTEIPNEFHQYENWVPASAFCTALELFHCMVWNDVRKNKEPETKEKEWGFTIHRDDGSASIHSFDEPVNCQELIKRVKVFLHYNDMAKVNHEAWWDPTDSEKSLWSYQLNAVLSLKEVRQMCREPYVEFDLLYSIVQSLYPDDDGCTNKMEVFEDRSLKIYRCCLSTTGRVTISLDAEGHIDSTDGIALLEALKTKKTHIYHHYSPGFIKDFDEMFDKWSKYKNGEFIRK